MESHVSAAMFFGVIFVISFSSSQSGVGGDRVAQFELFSLLKCNDTAVCLKSEPDETICAFSQGECVVECRRQNKEPKYCVGVNYRPQQNICDEFYSNANISDSSNFALGKSSSYVDECLINNGGCSDDAQCINTRGSFRCTCNAGFSGNGSICTDVNECQTNNGGCSVHAQCGNTRGSFLCTCNAGFSGNGSICTANLVACINSWMNIACPSNTHIAIVYANYGRTSRTTCPSASDFSTNCKAPTSMSFVMQQCQAKPTCSVLASVNGFGDPCPGTDKYLEVTYSCA